MNCAGIIAEWNPFHRGHLVPLAAARRAGATHIVAVMSGNFVQRGEPALCPWPYRVRAALQSGCDLVVQLPLPYAMATAERFAAGGVALLSALGCVDALAFGCEAGDAAPLWRVAALLDSPDFPLCLAEELQGGASFAGARQRAVEKLSDNETGALLSQPNNILAIEYLLAMQRQHCSFSPLAVPRCGAGHDADETAGGIASASLLRKMARAGEDLSRYIPEVMALELACASAEGALPELSLLERPLMAKLRSMTPDDFAALPDLSEGLENRLYRESRTACSPAALLEAVKTKRYSYARLRRILLAAWLGISPELCRTPPPYLRILGMNERGQEILAAAKGKASLPISASLAELGRTGEDALRFARLESGATDLYYTITPTIHPCDEEYTRLLIKVSL